MNAALAAVRRLGAVAVPHLGPRPELYHTTNLAAGLLFLGIVGVVLYTAQCLGVNRRAAQGIVPWAPVLLTFVLMVVPTVAGIVLIQTGKHQASDREDAYDTKQSQVQEQIAPHLAAEYGVVIHYSFEIPTEDGDDSLADITVHGSRQHCFIVPKKTYEIRCGSRSSAEESIPLPVVDPGA